MGTVNFQPLHATRLRESAVNQVRELIERGALKAGDRLPSERTLTTLLGVSRTVVREAIRVLESIGVVEVRHGLGAFVRRAGAWHNLWTNWRLAHASRLFQLYEVREAMEAKAAELAATNASPDEIAALRTSLDELRASLHADLEAVVNADTTFHSRLVRASKNVFLIEAIESMHEALADDRKAIFTLNRRGEKSYREHERIVLAIERSAPRAAGQAVRRHFRNVIADFKRSLVTEMPASDSHGVRTGADTVKA